MLPLLCYFFVGPRQSHIDFILGYSWSPEREPVLRTRAGRASEPRTNVAIRTTPVGFEPARGDPIGLAGRRLNRSAKVSLVIQRSCAIPNESGSAPLHVERSCKAAYCPLCQRCCAIHGCSTVSLGTAAETMCHSAVQPLSMHGTSGLVAMKSASHAKGRQFDPGLVYMLHVGVFLTKQ